MRNVILVLLGFITMACTSKKEVEKPKVAVVISTLNNPWFVVLAESAVANANRLGYEAKIFDSQNNPANESNHFENLIASGYDAILFNPTDADGSISNILKAKKAGVPVFCMDREVNSNEAATSQILSDNYSGCIAIGVEFVKTIGEKGKYVEILGLAGDNNTYARSNGFHTVVDQFPGLEMIAQQNGDFDRNKAMEVMETILQANDSIDEVVEKIKAGEIVATGMQYPKVMAKTAAEYADQYFQGKRNFPQHVPVAVDLVTMETSKNF